MVCERGGLLTKNQAGLQKNRRTVDGVILLQDKISNALKSNEHLLGLSKALKTLIYDPRTHLDEEDERLGSGNSQMNNWVKGFKEFRSRWELRCLNATFRKTIFHT